MMGMGAKRRRQTWNEEELRERRGLSPDDVSSPACPHSCPPETAAGWAPGGEVGLYLVLQLNRVRHLQYALGHLGFQIRKRKP